MEEMKIWEDYLGLWWKRFTVLKAFFSLIFARYYIPKWGKEVQEKWRNTNVGKGRIKNGGKK